MEISRKPLPLLVAAAVAAMVSCSSGAQTPPGPPESASKAAGASAIGEEALPAVPDLPTPEFTEVAVPAGTSFEVTLDTPLASNRSRIEDPVRANVADAVMVRGLTAIPAGTEIVGTVLEVDASGRANGRALLALRFLALRPYGTEVRVRTDRLTREAAADGTEVTLPAGTTFRLSLDDAIRVRVPNQ